jgi:hypothetical protein
MEATSPCPDCPDCMCQQPTEAFANLSKLHCSRNSIASSCTTTTNRMPTEQHQQPAELAALRTMSTTEVT